MLQITSKDHFDDVVSRAAGADGHEGYHDAQGNWRVPHKLMMVEVHAGWCRVCKGLQPKLLKLVKKHPEVLCCKINKTKNEVRLDVNPICASRMKLRFRTTNFELDMHQFTSFLFLHG